MVHSTIGRGLFSVVYTLPPNQVAYLARLLERMKHNEAAKALTKQAQEVLMDVKERLEKMKVFNIGDRVMVFLRR